MMAKNKIRKNSSKIKSQKHFLEKWLGRYLGGKVIFLVQKGLGASSFLLGIVLILSLVSYHPSDPSLTTQSSTPINNWLFYFGAVIADILFNFVGQIPAYGVALVFLLWGIVLLSPMVSNGEKNNKSILTRLSFLHFILLWCFLFFAGTIKVIGLLALGRYVDNNISLTNQQYPLSVLENFWAGMLVPPLADHVLLWVIVFLVAVFLALLLFLLSGMTFLEWRLLGRWLLSLVGFFIYAIFYALASVVGGILLLLYRLLVLVLPMVKIFIPRPSFIIGQQAVWKRIWQKLWHDIVAMPREKNNMIVETRPPDNQTLTGDNMAKPQLQSAAKASSALRHYSGGQKFPPLELLVMGDGQKNQKLSANQENQTKQMAEKVNDALAQFGATGHITAVKIGPVITLYEFEPEVGIKNAQVIGLAGDLARALSATAVRIAPMAGRNVLGIEVPNQNRDQVYLGELVGSKLFQDNTAILPLILGKNIFGQAMVVDLSQMPHLLISGTTGSGKSVAMNGFLLSLLYRHTPESLRLILIDPKMLELSIYQNIPHLLSPVVTDPKKSVMALLWATREMERRYKLLSELGVRNLADYRKKVKHTAENLPYIVVMVDEMADLMLVMGKEVEVLVQRLAQMARAAGIHLIMATQRPSVDVITGTIKANFPTRISYALPTRTDSRTILGVEGAEQLLGMGDFLLMSGGRVARGHAPFTSEGEVKKVTDWWRQQAEPDYLPTEDLQKSVSSRDMMNDMMGGGEDMYSRAVEVVRREKKASTSFLQRHLQIGYNRAANLMEQLEKNGVVSPANHSGKREVL
ncbi:MAG: DNA translocase FtsK 4TM domain-containing protein [Alphaproteobacteria bacterium]